MESPEPQVTSSPQVSGEEFSSSSARKAKINSEILHEIILVVFDREPGELQEFKSKGDFGNWADTLNQGASFEGVYNGFTHSSEYRKLETLAGKAPQEAFKVFSEELAVLISAEPDKEIVPLSQEALRPYKGLSLYGLKRVLGDEALRIVNDRGTDREKLAQWYSKWVIHMTQRKVDFGIPLRNNPDANFHYKWALASSEDQLKWEILNRLHRLLNKQNGPQKNQS